MAVATETKIDDVRGQLPAARGVFAACNSGNPNGIASVFAGNAVFTCSDGPDVVGAPAIGPWYGSWFVRFTGAHTLTIDEVQALGDWAFSRGTFTAMLTPKAGGETLSPAGIWLALHELQPDGSSMIHRLIYKVPAGVQTPEK